MATSDSTESRKAAPPAVERPNGLIDFADSDLIIGLVGPVGTELQLVVSDLVDRLKSASYTVAEIRVSSLIIAKGSAVDVAGVDEATRIERFREAGDEMRKDSGDNAILADGVARVIADSRAQAGGRLRNAFIVNSLKHPEEVVRLRRIYPGGFYLIGVQPDTAVRDEYLKRKGVADDQRPDLVARDQDDSLGFGQKVNDTFHLADFFIRMDGDRLRLQGGLERICRILFGDPYSTPTFDEFAMFLAFASSLRSADLSRQVGAVVARRNEILATGANDCPSAGGGLYWPGWIDVENRIGDKMSTRDYKRGGDSNREQQNLIINEIVAAGAREGISEAGLRKVLEGSRIRDITEYGRVVHAEMEALLSAARNGVGTIGSEMYCTTFPCHNCAKHIVAAGVERVVFIEPYRKSKALELHPDAIQVGPPSKGGAGGGNLVRFEPFMGVGPRRFFDLFSMRLGAGRELIRKNKEGGSLSWTVDGNATLRVQMRPGSYLDLEREAVRRFADRLKK